MSNYNIEELVTRWEREKLTTEQAVGQILLMLRALSERMKTIERWKWKQEKVETK